MKKLSIFILAVILFFAGPALAKMASFDIAVHETGAASGTSPFYIKTASEDVSLFARKADSTSGVSDFILADRGIMPNQCWSIQVTSATYASDTTFDLSYKSINVDPSTAAWTAAPLVRIMKNVSTDSGVSVYPVHFQPPPGKHLRFYLTHGATAFSAFEATVLVTDNANCTKPEVVRLGVESLTLNTSGVSNFTEPDDVKEAWVNLIGGPFRMTDSSVSGVSNVGQKYYDGDSLVFKGKDDIDKARIMLDSTASSGNVYIIYYGRP